MPHYDYIIVRLPENCIYIEPWRQSGRVTSRTASSMRPTIIPRLQLPPRARLSLIGDRSIYYPTRQKQAFCAGGLCQTCAGVGRVRHPLYAVAYSGWQASSCFDAAWGIPSIVLITAADIGPVCKYWIVRGFGTLPAWKLPFNEVINQAICVPNLERFNICDPST